MSPLAKLMIFVANAIRGQALIIRFARSSDARLCDDRHEKAVGGELPTASRSGRKVLRQIGLSANIEHGPQR